MIFTLRVKRAVQLAYGRVPNSDEWDRLQKYLEKMTAYHELFKTNQLNILPQSPALWLRRTLETHLSMKRYFRCFKDYQYDKKLIKFPLKQGHF